MKQFFDSDDEFHSAMEEIIENVPTTTTKEIFRSFLNIRPKVFDECYWQLNEFHKEFSTYIANHLTEAIDFIKNDCSEFDFVLLSEIFDEIVEESKSREFIETLRETAKKYPKACEEYNIITCIEEAEGYL